MTTGKTLTVALALVAAAALPPRVAAEELVPFVIPATPNPESLIAFKAAPIAPDSPRITVRDGHFFLGAKRFRVWGVNTCFGANFPTHADAERIAARLAAAGVNSVRFHHLDTTSWPSGILDPANPLKLHPEALERLDYFIDQLARHGIYANINLHVGRAASKPLGLPPPNTGYDKIVGLFTPALIEAQKQYARDLLGHVNAYRKVRYADDAAVAFVEITNEDSFFMWSGEQDLRNLPPFYATLLQGQYAAWLKAKYGDTAGVRRAWSEGAEPLGANLLTPDLASAGAAGKRAWRLEQHTGSAAAVTAKGDGPFRIEISQADETNWHLQFKQSPLPVKKGLYYTVSFRARADRPRAVTLAVGQEHEPWKNLGLARQFRLTPEWQPFRIGFVGTETDDLGRLSFSVGADAASVELADLMLATGGQEGLRPDESLEAATVALFGAGETQARGVDRMRFLMETEKGYFDGMRAFIQKDLGAKALVTGTSVFGTCGLFAQSGMDYIDGHAYWQHPSFPGKPWDSANWTVGQKAMVDSPASATLPHLASERLAGKPYTVSEYNHSAPNDFQAECVPLAAAYGAAQDWDGIWLFAYSHRTGDVDIEAFRSFFDIDQNPAKWGFMPAGAALFREAGLPPLPDAKTYDLGVRGDLLAELALLHVKHDRDLLDLLVAQGRSWESFLAARFAFALPGSHLPAGNGPAPHLTWIASAETPALFSATSIGGSVLVGHVSPGQPLGVTHIELAAPAFAAVTVTALDGLPLATSGSVLVTACGRCENTGMVFSADRRSVGRNWGTGPVRIEPVTGVVRLPPGQWTCQALGPDGKATASVPVITSADRRAGPTIRLSPQYRTMWYLATRPAAKAPK